MLSVIDISKNFGDFTAINKLSFEVNVGDVMGFLGPNGAGKTTSMRVITGYLKSDSGNVIICLLYTSPSPRDLVLSRMPSSA